MTLEPTEEQRQALANAIMNGGARRLGDVVETLWAYVRDQVLEAAAKTVEDIECDWQDEGVMQEKAVAALRAMKGKL